MRSSKPNNKLRLNGQVPGPVVTRKSRRSKPKMQPMHIDARGAKNCNFNIHVPPDEKTTSNFAKLFSWVKEKALLLVGWPWA